MAPPFPPTGAQQPYTERPLKIYGEQYVAGATLPAGVVTTFPGDPPIFSDSQPRVLLPSGWVAVAATAWVISSRYTGQPIEVISNEEFTERFGPGGGPA